MTRLVARSLGGAIVTIAVVIGLGSLSARTVSALTFVPPSFDWTLAPGQSRQDVIKLYNDTDAPITLYTVTAPFTAKDETGTPAFDLTTKSTDLASWITISAGPITINPSDKAEVPFQVTVPAKAEPGGHYAGIFVGNQGDTSAAGTQVNIRALSGPLMILRVSGKVTEAATLAQLGVDGGTVLTRLPATLFARIQNTGNVHVRPTGTITVANMFGSQTVQLQANDSNGAVLPETTRRFDVTWAKGNDAAQKGGFFSEIGAEWRNFSLGSYTVKAALTYGTAKTPLTGSFTVWIIPWHLLLVELLLLVVIVFGLIFGIKRYNAAIVRNARARPYPPSTNGR